VSELETTERGFRVFGRVPSCEGHVVVRESCLAFEGAHVLLCHEVAEAHHPANAPERFTLRDRLILMTPRVSVASAKQLVVALQAFIAEAEGDMLTEPAEGPEEE
jgi:hypothetical protein